jgi:hypothetical protein
MPHTPTPLHTVHYTCILSTYSHREGGRGKGGRGGEIKERRLEGQQFTKLGRKYQHDRPVQQYIKTDKNLLMTTISFGVYIDN